MDNKINIQIDPADEPLSQDEVFSGGLSISEALTKLRLRLLDLTGRNRLLNFKSTAGKSLQFIDGRLTNCYQKLIESPERRIQLHSVPEPKRTEFVVKLGKSVRPDVRDYAKGLGIGTTYDLNESSRSARELNGLRALMYPEDLERQCRKLASTAKTAIEETGANMLFLLLGFLEFPESPGASKTFLAPLVPIPVSLEKGELERATGTYRYSLVYTGEELTENLSLREKLRQDFNIELPDFTEESTLDSYYDELLQSIDGKEGFKLRRLATLALVSITKMLLVRDLDPQNWPAFQGQSELADHEIVKMVFEGATQSGGSENDNEEYSVDFHKHADLPLIFDADSSQHSALIDILDGKNLVVEGPPGTGKSQTITNLIASAIASGKKVLFVAEKLAALQVVRNRLTQAGLADFCLELHSNKTSKKDVLDSIERRATKKYPRPLQLDSMVEALKEKRRALTNYVELINTQSSNAQGLTIHQILWRAERHRQKTGNSWQKAQKLKVRRATELTKSEFDSLYDQLRRLVMEHERIKDFGPAAPFWGFFPASLPPASEVEIDQAIRAALPCVEALRDRYHDLAKFVDMAKIGLTKDEAKQLSNSLASLSSTYVQGMAEELLPRLFENLRDMGNEAQGLIDRLKLQKERATELRAQFDGKVHSNLVVNENLRKEALQILNVLRNLGLASLTPRQLEDVGVLCGTVSSDTRSALEDIKVLAESAGHQFQGTEKCIIKARLPIEISGSCPRLELHRRIPELGAKGSAKIILEAKRRFAAIEARANELGGSLYLDGIVLESEVQEAVQVLREGDEWWRFFQSRQRKAVAFHKRLAKQKKVARSVRRQELEALYEHLRDVRLANEDIRYRGAMGSHWSEGRTEFDGLHSIAHWIEESNARLEEAGLDGNVFSPLEVSATQVAVLAKFGDRLSKGIAQLDDCTKYVTEGQLRNAAAINSSFLNAETWQVKIQLLDSLGKRLIQFSQLLSSYGPSSLACEEIVLAFGFLGEFQKIKSDIDSDLKTKELLQERHSGLATDLEPVYQALAYGRSVIKLSLPKELTEILLSVSGQETRKSILENLGSIEKAWQPIDEFCDFLSERGRFEIEEWAGVEQSSASFIDGFISRLRKAQTGIDGLLPWVQYINASEFSRERGLGDFVSLIENNEVPREHAPDLFGYRFYGTISEQVFDKHRELGRFSALSHEAVRDEFAKLDKEIIKLRGREVAAISAGLAKPPAGSSGARVADKTERVLLHYLFPQARPRMSIRKMMIQAGAAIQEYKPCFMMGPQAVAQYLAPGAIQFDIVVMDEASQLKPEEALGSIARGKQLIVVGDPKQLPPTTFFDKLGETQGDEDGQEAAVMQPSILEVCIGHFRPVRTLRWHYRSQHQSLIAFSNARFYRNNLIVFPSPYDRSRNLGCKMHFVHGATYDSQMNIKEATVVVDAVISHMQEHPGESLGVVTLNLKQTELIEEILQKRVRDLSFVDEYLRKHEKDGNGFFVKNLENVQGDERDVIFISTTFGPALGTNVVAQRFGPISQRDGWRRLNVLFTRAKKSLILFTSMRPEDIVDGDNVPRGRRELRAYLEYLRSGVIPQSGGSSGEPDSDFEVSVMDALERHGYECTPQLGVAGYRIDLAVKHPLYPGTHLAAIECDGASYHSGRSARDRDRIRQEILERLGWEGRIYRIWSTDWYRAPAKEMGRIVAWLDALKAKPIDEAYIVSDTTEIPSPTSPMVAAQVAEIYLDHLDEIIDGEGAVEVQVGDKVTFFNLAQDKEASVVIGTRTDEAHGIIDYRTPLAEALLGLQIGEIGPMTIPDRPTVRLRVLKIERERDRTR